MPLRTRRVYSRHAGWGSRLGLRELVLQGGAGLGAGPREAQVRERGPNGPDNHLAHRYVIPNQRMVDFAEEIVDDVRIGDGPDLGIEPLRIEGAPWDGQDMPEHPRVVVCIHEGGGGFLAGSARYPAAAPWASPRR